MDPPLPHRMRIHPLIRPPPPPPSSTDTNFPILAISILGILTTAILLLSYYVFVIKCCLNWRRSELLRRLSRSRSIYRSHHAAAAPSYSAAVSESRGLEESAIQAIPTFRYRGATGGGGDHRRKMPSFHECAVCLNEFQEEERIRLLPTCLHVFHIDCIDTWLQSNANCPLCRSGITAGSSIEAEKLMVVSSSPRSGDVVIEVRDQEEPPEEQERRRRRRRRHHLGSMGDECIDVRGGKDGELCVQPIRRSFSMDSSSNQQLYQAVQEILQRNPHFKGVAGGEGSSAAAAAAGRARRNFFSCGNYRSSRSSVLPIKSFVVAL